MENKKSGFTLAELLIVIAIIAILVSLSLPLFINQIKRANAKTDQAFVRSAKAAAVSDYTLNKYTGNKTYCFDSGMNIIDANVASAINGYGKSSEELTGDLEDGATGVPKNNYITVTVSQDGTVKAYWGEASNGSDDNPTPVPTATPEPTSTPDSDDNNFNFNPSITWNEIKNTPNGVTMPPGTVFSDGEDLYIVYGNQNYYNLYGDETDIGIFIERYSNYIEKVTNSITLIQNIEYLTNMEIDAGTIWLFQDKYYVAKQDFSYNEWEKRVPIYGTSYEGDGRWALIEGQN